MILTSLLAGSEARTPVVTLSEIPSLSSWSSSFLIFSWMTFSPASFSSWPSASIRGGVSSPLAEEATEAFLEASLEVGVFFAGLPSASRLA